MFVLFMLTHGFVLLLLYEQAFALANAGLKAKVPEVSDRMAALPLLGADRRC